MPPSLINLEIILDDTYLYLSQLKKCIQCITYYTLEMNRVFLLFCLMTLFCFYFSAVDGQWSTWSLWSGCGAGLCGGDRKIQTRSCTNPAPNGGGRTCQGENYQTQDCPGWL